MKRIILCIACSAILVISGCGDRISFFQKKPVVKLKGNLDNYLAAGEKYQDEGATAYDEDDGDISDRIIVSGLPSDNTKERLCIIKYKVVNSKGVSSNEISRNVTFISPYFSSGYESKGTDIQPHPESRYVLAVGIYGLYVFDRTEDRLVKILPYKTPFRGCASVSSDGSKIAVKNKKNVDIWDSSSWTVTDSFRAVSDDSEDIYIENVLFEPQGYTLVTTDSNDNIKLWDASTGVLLSSIETENSGGIKFNSDGTKIGAGEKSWYVADGTAAQKFEPDSEYPWKKDSNEDQKRAGGSPWEKHYDADNESSSYPFREKEEDIPKSEPDNLPTYPWASKGTYVNTETVDSDGNKSNTWEKVD